jgi:hypothetical protein
MVQAILKMATQWGHKAGDTIWINPVKKKLAEDSRSKVQRVIPEHCIDKIMWV